MVVAFKKPFSLTLFSYGCGRCLVKKPFSLSLYSVIVVAFNISIFFTFVQLWLWPLIFGWETIFFIFVQLLLWRLINHFLYLCSIMVVAFNPWLRSHFSLPLFSFGCGAEP